MSIFEVNMINTDIRKFRSGIWLCACQRNSIQIGILTRVFHRVYFSFYFSFRLTVWLDSLACSCLSACMSETQQIAWRKMRRQCIERRMIGKMVKWKERKRKKKKYTQSSIKWHWFIDFGIWIGLTQNNWKLSNMKTNELRHMCKTALRMKDKW